jgi:hypothetical protein
MHSFAQTIASMFGETVETGYLIIGLALGFVLGFVLGRRRPIHITSSPHHSDIKSSTSTNKAPRTLDQSLSSSEHSFKSSNHFNLPAQVMTEVRILVMAGNKIQAIKVVREATGLGLAEAKSLVDAL